MSDLYLRISHCMAALLALLLSQWTLADTDTTVDITCDDNKPVIMLVAGRTLDAGRMRDYAIALQQSDLYPNARGYYLNNPRPVRILEGDPDVNDVALMVRFPSECSAVNFWYDDFYQSEIKPLRLNPSAGDYVVTLYDEASLPPYMADKVGDGSYLTE
jgi:hypothetical protein